jgi:MFS family permease
MGMSIGMLISPLLGGVVYDKSGYNAVFGMCYALIGLDIILRLLLVEKKVAARWDPNAMSRKPVRAEDRSNETATTDIELCSQTLGSGSAKGRPIAATQKDAGIIEAQSDVTPRKRRRDRLPPVLSLLYSRRLLASLFCALIQALLITSFDSVLTHPRLPLAIVGLVER